MNNNYHLYNNSDFFVPPKVEKVYRRIPVSDIHRPYRYQEQGLLHKYLPKNIWQNQKYENLRWGRNLLDILFIRLIKSVTQLRNLTNYLVSSDFDDYF